MTIRQIAVTLLNEYEANGTYVNLSLSSHLTDTLTPSERGALTALLYTTVERKLTLDYLIGAISKRSTDKLDPYTLNILRLGACQILYMTSIPDYAAVNETVKLARQKGERSFVNGVLRTLIRCKDANELPTPDREKNVARYISVNYSFPLPLVRHFISLYGVADTERLLDSFNNTSYTDITVNTRRISREDYLERLRLKGITAEPSKLSELTVRINGSVDPRTLPGFDEGLFFVEDTASAVSALALGTREGDRVIDVCAAPGGKSFAAAILAGEGSVTAFDIHESKLSLISSGAERLGLNVTVLVNDATMPKEELFGRFDRVICDCPCSGLGVLGKKADMRYRSQESMAVLPALQYEILANSAKYLHTGGTLVYSTCTLNPDENERVAERFLSENEDFVLVPFTVGTLQSDGMLTLTPHEHYTDGFFISKFEKVR